MKKIIQRNLPLDQQYSLSGVFYQSIEDGGGWCCDNCGKLITNVASIQNKEGVNYNIGLDCLDTILENNNLLSSEDYIQYLYSDKPAIQKAKSLRSKILSFSKKYNDFVASLVLFEDGRFGFNFSYQKEGRDCREPLGWDYTFRPEYKELTLNYVKNLISTETITK